MVEENRNDNMCKVLCKRKKNIGVCVNLSESACVMEMRGGMRRGRVVGRDTLLRISGERVRSRGRSQQGTCKIQRGKIGEVDIMSEEK